MFLNLLIYLLMLINYYFYNYIMPKSEDSRRLIKVIILEVSARP